MHAGWLKVAVGTGRRRSMNERDRAIIAAHEVGHAICGKVHGDARRVEEISLFAHGEALGVTVSSQEDNDLPAESDLRSEEHTSELQSRLHLVCRLLLEKKKKKQKQKKREK